MLIKICLSLEPGGAGTIQGLPLQLYIKKRSVSFPTTNSIATVATTAAQWPTDLLFNDIMPFFVN